MARSKIAEDFFTRPDGNIGSDWTYIRPTTFSGTPPQVQSNTVASTAGSGNNFKIARWDGAGTFSNDQYAKIAISVLNFNDANYRLGVVVRCSAETNASSDYYVLWVQGDGASNRTTKLVRVVNDSQTDLDSRTIAWAVGDTLSLEAVGSTLTAYKNDVALYSVSDSTLTTGKPGLMVAGVSTTPRGDNWEGGDVTSAPTYNLTASNCTLPSTSSTVVIAVGSSGTLTTPALKNNTGSVLANETGITAFVYNASSGALVVPKTGQTTNASGVMTITDPTIIASTVYRVVIVLASGAEGMDKITAT